MKYTRETLAPIVAKSICIADVCRELNIKCNCGGAAYLKKRIQSLDINTDHFVQPGEVNRRRGKCAHNRKSPEEILILKTSSNYRVQGAQLVRALVEVGRPYICAECGCLPEWQGKPLTLQVDHIDGNPLNNIKDNLQFLCPNCHSQTIYFDRSNKEQIRKMITIGCVEKMLTKDDNKCAVCANIISYNATHCPKCAARIRCAKTSSYNRPAKIEWPPVDELRKMVEDSSYLAVGRELGVSDNAVRKRLKTKA